MRRNGTLSRWWGTSFSAPQVAGVCALLAAIRPGITHEQARLLLCAGADDGVGEPAEDIPGFDSYYGYGRLNVYNTLLLALIHIDSMNLTNNSFQLSWFSPPNASNKKSSQVETTTVLTDAWTIANTTAFVYTNNRTYWTDTNTVDNVKFYRIKIHPVP